MHGGSIMTRRLRIAAFSMGTLAAALFAATGGAAPKQPRIETGPDAEVTFDGLVRVQKSVVDAAWVKPTLDLTPYKKLMVVSQGVSFRKLEPVSDFQARKESQFPVKEENKERLSRELKTAFETELGKLERYQIVNQPGPDVLLLVGAVIDVVSNIPPDVTFRRALAATGHPIPGARLRPSRFLRAACAAAMPKVARVAGPQTRPLRC